MDQNDNRFVYDECGDFDEDTELNDLQAMNQVLCPVCLDPTHHVCELWFSIPVRFGGFAVCPKCLDLLQACEREDRKALAHTVHSNPQQWSFIVRDLLRKQFH